MSKDKIHIVVEIVLVIICIGLGWQLYELNKDNDVLEQKNTALLDEQEEPAEEPEQVEEEPAEDEVVKESEEVVEEPEIVVVPDPNDTQVVVNKHRQLPDGYAPTDLVVPHVKFSYSGVQEKSYMREEAADALESLFQMGKDQGIILYAVSGYRSYDRQVEIYDNNVKTKGQEYTDTVSSKPGLSEHQTGLAMDVSSKSNNFNITEPFGDTVEGKWLAENAHKAGFIIRYPEGKDDITGYTYEPWHVRYVGVETATAIYNQDVTLEEYYGLVQ